jgi:hypothetical protein
MRTMLHNENYTDPFDSAENKAIDPENYGSYAHMLYSLAAIISQRS